MMRGWTPGRSLLVQNFVEYPPGGGGGWGRWNYSEVKGERSEPLNSDVFGSQ